MTRVLNFGSINIDHVYKVEHFARPGETIDSLAYRRHAGGKGLNQSIALAHAGASVFHAGKVGREDGWLTALLSDHQVDTRYVTRSDAPSGHAVIQVNANGENAIVIAGGANRTVCEAEVAAVLADFGPNDMLLVQNEISAVPAILRLAHDRGMTVVFNPAPMTAAVLDYPLDRVDIFMLNETEAAALTGCDDAEGILARLTRRFPRAALILTRGARGAVYCREGVLHRQPGEPVEVVDTTAAGDTFAGFFLAEFIRCGDPAQALAIGCRAAAICITRPGAAESIPDRQEVPLGTIQATVGAAGQQPLF